MAFKNIGIFFKKANRSDHIFSVEGPLVYLEESLLFDSILKSAKENVIFVCSKRCKKRYFAFHE